MTQTESALFIIEIILLLFGVSLMRASFSGIMVNNECVFLVLFCAIVLYYGVWLDGLN